MKPGKRWDRRMEYGNVFRDADGNELEIKIKTKSSNSEEKCKTLSFIAKTSHRFYLEVANQLENFFSQPG